MDFGTAIAIGSTLLGAFSGGGSSSAPTDTGGGTNDALGFIKQGARAFNLMRSGGSGYGNTPSPFQTDIKFKDTGDYYKKFGAKSGATPTTPQFTPYRIQNADVDTAIVNLYNNAQNQQMKQLIAQYSGGVAPNIQVGRKTQAAEQPSLRTIQV